MDRFTRRFQRKSRSDEKCGPAAAAIRIDAISLRLLERPPSFKTPKDTTIVVRLTCNGSTIHTDGLAFAPSMVWNPQHAYEVQMADITVDVILKKAELLKRDRKIGSFLVNAAQLASDGQEGVCEKIYRSPMSDKNPSLELSIVISGLPSSSSTAPPQAEPSAAQSSLQETDIYAHRIESVVDEAAGDADALHSPAGLETGIEVIDTVTAAVGRIQSALKYAETLQGTLDCLADCAGYVNGVVGLVKDFADIHPISKIAVGALTKVYDLVKSQGQRDESIRGLALCMRDMLASLSEVKDLKKIGMLRSVISIAMTRVDKCAEFIISYTQHGFWGRLARQSLSSYTADTIQQFQQAFTELRQKFTDAVSIQILKVVSESHQVMEAFRTDLRSLEDTFLAKDERDLLDKLPRSKSATYDLALRCLQGTRQGILRRIYDWIDSKEHGDNVFWLRGPAGSGKSTIASTVAGLLDGKIDGFPKSCLGSLGATFFCKRDDNTLNQPSLVFPTIAFRLASTCPLLRKGILSTLQTNQDIGESALQNQFRELIVDPLSKLPSDLVIAPMLIIVDALDECGNEYTRKTLLPCLEQVRQLPIWFKLLVTSRPEPDITRGLAAVLSGLEVDTLGEESISDITAYTRARVIALRTHRRLGNDWPGDSKVDQLVSYASGLFIWTTLSFDFMSRQPSPKVALELVLKQTGMSHLDALYRTVLVQDLADARYLGLIRSILGCVVVSKVPLSLPSICALLGISDDEGEWVKDKLASVLIQGTHSVIRAIHPSFIDFLTDEHRSKEFFVDVGKHNVHLARGCLRVMNSKLRMNICRLSDQTVLNSEVSDLASHLGECVPEELAYSCEFWSTHLKQAPNQDPTLLPLWHEFCNTHILHWLEVMSLEAETKNAIIAVRSIEKWLPPDDISVGLVQDLIRFSASFGYIITQSAPHIYLSAALFIPPESPISNLSRGEFRVPPEAKALTGIAWDPGLLTLNGHTNSVTSVAFSPDGKKIVSGSVDKTLRVWDAESGSSILDPLLGHTDWVRSVAFSPDGKKIVSGSRDKTLRVWDAESGSSILDPLLGHTDSIRSVAFSPDGKKIVSGSHDMTLRVWDAESGSSILDPLLGHTHWVTSVAFSPDGKKIVSGSSDKTLRVWDAESGSSILDPLLGHTDSITSVAFSPDGKKIVSGSADKTLRVWDAESGSSILDPLLGHTDLVTSVAFSPDGKKIVSGSYDKTLRVWDAESGSSILDPLLGYTNWVTSVAFSPDGKKIVSGSGDDTLRVWDAESGSSILDPLLGHTDLVTSVAFSPDGKKIVSGSWDKTLRVWDAESGSSILDPLLGHTDWVTLVAFSPDGKKIVSGSADKTLRVWDAESGSSILNPLLGHTNWVTSVAFSPDGKKIVSGSEGKMLRVWDAEAGSSILDPSTLADLVTSIGFSYDGSHSEAILSHADSAVPASHSFTHDIVSFHSPSPRPATFSDNGWVVDSYGRMVLWVPAHLRGDSFAAALCGSRVVWFDANGLPIIANGLGLSFWSRNATL